MFDWNYKVDKEDYANAGKVSSQIKQVFKEIGIDPITIRKMAVACYEAEINMIIHSNGGSIYLSILEDSVEMKFVDTGPGIIDVEKALTPGFSTANEKAREFGFGAGMGLPNIKRVSDQFAIESSVNGTTLTLGFSL